MPRSVRSVGLFCLSILGSIIPLVGPRTASADTTPAVTGSQSSPPPPNTAKSGAGQSPTPRTDGAPGVNPQAPSTTPLPAPGTAGVDAPPSAAAPSPEAQAAAGAALVAGQTAYASGDYVLAEAQFRAALAQVPSAAAQYGLAMTLDLEAKPAEACDAFAVLFAMPDFAALPAEQARSAQQRFSVLQTIPASVVVVLNAPTATLEVDGVPQAGESPFTLRLPAGKHTIKAQANDYEPTELAVEVKPAEQREVNLTLKEIPKPAPAKPEPVTSQAPTSPPPSKVPAYVTLGVAGAAAITGTIFGVQALGAKSTFDKDPTVGHADDVERNALIADMAFGVAFTLGITGLVLLVTDEPTDPAAEAPVQTALELIPYVSKTSGGAAARMTW